MRARIPMLLAASFSLGCAFVRCPPPREASAGPKAVPVPAELAKSVELARVARGLSRPVFLTVAPGDPRKRLFVVEKTGTIRILRRGKNGLKSDPNAFLDLSERVSGASEQGLLGLAFHPEHAGNRRLFVNFTDTKGDTRVVEFKVDEKSSDRVDPESEREILRVDQPYSNHNGGHLAFGPDGKLYVGLGDGGWAGDPHGNGQKPGSLLGKMLQLDVDAKDPKPVVWQKGHRNPWRYSFDRLTGDLYVADVGQNRYEEVHVLAPEDQKGANLGWNVMEGLHCFKAKTCDREGLDLPAIEYAHPAGCSITGGYVYRGTALPELAGHYFYADYCTALIRSFRWRGKDEPVADSWDWRPALDPAEKLARISSFGEDEQGELYLLTLDGDIYRLQRKPTAE